MEVIREELELVRDRPATSVAPKSRPTALISTLKI